MWLAKLLLNLACQQSRLNFFALMKILKSTLVLILIFNYITSCSADDILDESETNTIKNIQAKVKGDKVKKVTKEKKKD